MGFNSEFKGLINHRDTFTLLLLKLNIAVQCYMAGNGQALP